MKSAFLILLMAIVAWAEPTDHYVGEYEGRPHGRGGTFCDSRHDGRYAVGCVPHFVSCAAKESSIMTCGRGLFFDEHAHKCVPKWYASSCHGHRRPHHGYIPHYHSVEPEHSDFCKHRRDGDYSIGCTSCYIACSGKRPIAMECPAGLILDEESDMCVARAYARACGGTPTTTTTYRPPPKVHHVKKHHHKPCHYHHNGFFAMGCSSRYLVCINGRENYHFCRDGFAFDERRQTCAPKHTVKLCGRFQGSYEEYKEVGEAY